MKSLFLLLSISLFSTFVFAQDCNSVSATGGNGQISVTGLSGAPIIGVQVFNSSWASVYNQSYTNQPGSVNVPSLPAGQYTVNVRFYTSAWASICEKAINATVTDGPPPQTCVPTFQKTFGKEQGNDEALNMVKTSDGGFIAVGQSAVSGTTNHDALVMKFDNNGILQWSKTFGGPQEDFLSQIAATADGGCIAAGGTNSNGFGPTFSGDCWLVRIDGSGNLLWQKRYFLSGTPGTVYAIITTSDGGYAFTGTFPFTPGPADWMVVKTDANGNIQWQKKMGSSSSDNCGGIIEDNTGGAGYVISGNVYSSTTWYDAVIAKLDLNGNLVWTKAWDFDSRANWTGPIYRVSDGLIFNHVNSDGFGSDNAKPAIVKTDFNGNIIWIKEFTIPNCRDARITVLPDDGFMMVQSELPHDVSSDIYLTRISAAGTVLWAKRYPRTFAQWLYALVPDGNFVVGAGFSTYTSYNDVMLVKADLNGKMGNCSSTDVTATVRNSVVNPLNFTWATNTALNLSPVNTTYVPAAFNPVTNVSCIDACATAVTISNATVNENAGSAVLQVCLGAPAASTMTYQYVTANGSATHNSDYSGGVGIVTFEIGQTCKSISIPIINDANVESTETFTVSIGSVVGTVTINDDDQPQSDCNAVTFTPGNNIITVSGITAPVATVQLFNSNWVSVFNQTYTNAPGTVNVPIGAGTYLVKVTFYTSGWAYTCDKSENVTVINTCPAGTICITNSCPSPTVDLNIAYAPVLPAGTTVTWHTGTPATDANKMTAEQAQNVSVSGTYYAAINISGANCYSATIPVNVTIINCSSPGGVVNAGQVTIESKVASSNITVFPNPFARSLRVIIDSEKKERATIALMDLQGRQLKQMPVQLSQGSNTILMEGLDQFPSGNYFLRINSESGVKTMKVLRQQ